MIKYDPKTWNMWFLFKGSIIKRLMGGFIFLLILTTTLCLLHIHFGIINVEMNSSLPGYMGAALGLLLVFRNNTAYDKWWEARKVLGALVNVSRNIAININNLVDFKNEEKEKFIDLLKAFPYAVKEHLRYGVKMKELRMVSGADYDFIKKSDHKPNSIANKMQMYLRSLHNKGMINDMQQYLLLGNINELIDILGKCERIKKTPIPIAYAFLLKFFIIIYVLIIPFGFIQTMGWSTIPLTIALYYLMMSIVTIAKEIEDPFGHELNDLPVDDICKNIERNIDEIMSGRANEAFQNIE